MFVRAGDLVRLRFDDIDQEHRTLQSFKVTALADREILIEREFHARRQLVFDAFTKPELVRRCLLGPSGWTMPVCEID
jgi:hypothetical protein